MPKALLTYTIVTVLSCLLYGCDKRSATPHHQVISNPASTYLHALYSVNEQAALHLSGQVLDSISWYSSLNTFFQHFQILDSSGLNEKQKADMLISIFFDTLKIEPVLTSRAPDTYLAHDILNSKKGSCTGLASLFLAIGDRFGLPLYGVLLPGHFYIRWHSATYTRNIETLRRGLERSQDYYREKFNLNLHPCYTMGNMEPKQSLSVLLFNLGNGYLDTGTWQKAVDEYTMSIKMTPNLADARGNMGICFYKLGKPLLAIQEFKEALALDPNSHLAWDNLGKIYYARGNTLSARECYQWLAHNYPAVTEYQTRLRELEP